MIKDVVKRQWYRALLIFSDEVFIRAQYRSIFGESLDLDHPERFDEKIQWLKINNRHSLMTQVADKYCVREYVAKQIGSQYLNELLWVGHDARNIPFDQLPSRFVIKTNHASQNTIIVKDKNKIDRTRIIPQLNRWLQYNYYLSGRQWAYKNIDRKVIVEKFLTDKRGGIPIDYKFFVFNGSIKFIQVDSDRFGDHRRDFFDVDWRKLPFTNTFDNADGELDKPTNLQTMLRLAKQLGSNFLFARIDLYDLESEVVFGEITLYPDSGYTRFSPEQYNKIIGCYLEF